MCAMRSISTALLCLGLCLSQTIHTQKQTFPKPIIWAKPPFMVQKGSSVTIWCQGTQKAVEYQLYCGERLSATKRPKLPGCRGKVEFHVTAMTSHTAGIYRCFYKIGELWSEPSAPLELVMTGMYDTPTLSVHPGPEVALRESLTFYCRLETTTGKFFLLKEDRPISQHKLGNIQGEFPLGPTTAAHKGTYRCFGSYNNHIWSFPSEPVTLEVTGDAGNTSHVPTDPTSSSTDSQDTCLGITESGFTREATGNLFRIGMACLVLVALLGLLVEERFCRKRAHLGANRAARWECKRLRVPSPLEAEPGAAGGSAGSSRCPHAGPAEKGAAGTRGRPRGVRPSIPGTDEDATFLL